MISFYDCCLEALNTPELIKEYKRLFDPEFDLIKFNVKSDNNKKMSFKFIKFCKEYIFERI